MKNTRIMASESGQPTEMAEGEVSSKPSGFTEAEKEKMKKFTKGSAPFLIAGQLLALFVMALVVTFCIDFGQIVKTTAKELEDLQSRIGFVFRYSTFGVMWVVVCLLSVISIRVRSPANDPTAGCEHLVQNAKNILNNSFEQLVMAVLSQLILVQHLDGEHTLNFIPALTLLFIVGRITYWLGYPQHRLFGFSLNITPLCITMFYNFFKTWELLF